MTASTPNEDFLSNHVFDTHLLGLAEDQGQKAIVANVQRKESEEKEREQTSRLAQAVAEAMRPDVTMGQQLAPTTPPEPRDTIQAGIKAVGRGGRKAVFSELPFDNEDIPEGWDVGQDEKGGWWTAPKENRPAVATALKEGKPEDILGYPSAKPEADEAQVVVSAKDESGTTIQDVVTTVADLPKAEQQAWEVGETVEIKTGREAIVERSEKLSNQADNETFDSMIVLEGNHPKVYKDSQGLKTVGVGFNMEQEGAQSIWESSGVQQNFNDVKAGRVALNDESTRALLKTTFKNSQKKAEARAVELGLDWGKLHGWHKTILSDIAFNTGSVRGWTEVFKRTRPKEVLREARRLEGGKYTAGMDNRAAKLGIQLGIINSMAEARRLGLSLASLDPRTVVSLIRGRQKAQPRRAT